MINKYTTKYHNGNLCGSMRSAVNGRNASNIPSYCGNRPFTLRSSQPIVRLSSDISKPISRATISSKQRPLGLWSELIMSFMGFFNQYFFKCLRTVQKIKRKNAIAFEKVCIERAKEYLDNDDYLFLPVLVSSIWKSIQHRLINQRFVSGYAIQGQFILFDRR